MLPYSQDIKVSVNIWLKLREKYLYLELVWYAFSRIQTEYGELLRISSYSV